MTSPSAQTERLDAECGAFCRYLANAEASTYVKERYREGHEHLPAVDRIWFDELLLGLSRRGAWGVGWADAYLRWFRPQSIVRLKLTLALAILENTPPYHGSVTACRTGRPWILVTRVTVRGVWYVVQACAAVVALGPLHAIAVLGQGGRR